MKIELPSTPASASLARRTVNEVCAAVMGDTDGLVLCTSELVTNALLHGTPPISLEVVVQQTCVRVAVHDAASQAAARRRSARADTLSGRGLDIVEALASRWGSDQTDSGKVAWFEMDLAG